MSKIVWNGAEDECWTWEGARMKWGYGTIVVKGRNKRAHRVSYELFVGPIPTGLDLDHLCRNRACVNPKHLEPVTRRENILRGDAPDMIGALNSVKMSCPKGHPYGGSNLYVAPNGDRHCRRCRKDAVRRHRARSAR